MAVTVGANSIVLKADNKKPAQGLQAYNKKIAKLIGNMNLQQKSRFDFILIRTPFDNTANPTSALQGLTSAVGSLVGFGVDMYIGKVYVQKITYGSNKFVTDRVNGDEYVKDIEYPSGVSINFLDDESGLCMRYLQSWIDSIALPASITSTKKGYIFKDNQEGARRTGFLYMAPTTGKFPWAYPRVTFYGLFPRSIGDITVAQDEKDNLTYDVDFSVREIRTATLI